MSRQLGDSRAVTRVEFALSDGSYPFVSVSEAESCAVILEKCLPQTDDMYAELFSRGCSPRQLVERIEDRTTVRRGCLAHRRRWARRNRRRDNCPVVSLADIGAVPRTVRSVDGRGLS